MTFICTIEGWSEIKSIFILSFVVFFGRSVPTARFPLMTKGWYLIFKIISNFEHDYLK